MDIKYKLIILQYHTIVVSNEKINEKNIFLDDNEIFECRNIFEEGIEDNNGLIHKPVNCTKIIAGLSEQPSIIYSLLSDEDLKKIGQVNIEKISQNMFEQHTKRSSYLYKINDKCKGYMGEDFFNKYNYTEKDIYNAIEYGVITARESKTVEQRTKEFIEPISEFQPILFNITLEITNNSIVKVSSIISKAR